MNKETIVIGAASASQSLISNPSSRTTNNLPLNFPIQAKSDGGMNFYYYFFPDDLMKRVFSMGDNLNSFSFSVTDCPSKSVDFDFFSSNLENESSKDSGLFCGILSHTTENILPFEKIIGSVKSASFVTNTRFSDFERSASLPFTNPSGAIITLYPSDLRNFSSLLLTFSSKRNLGLKGDADGDIISSSCKVCSVMQSSLDMLFSQGRETFYNFLGCHAPFQHLQNLPNHDSRALESGLAVTNFTVGDYIFAYFDSHDTIRKNEIFKDDIYAGENGV